MTPSHGNGQQSPRRPAAFSLEPDLSPNAANATAMPRRPQSFDVGVELTPDAEDPFLGSPRSLDGVTPGLEPRRRFSFAKVAAGALGILLSLAFGLWTDSLIENLFSRADWLGYTALAVVAVGILAILGMVVRETAGMMRLAAVHAIRAEAEAAALEAKPGRARALIARLSALFSNKPVTAKGRAALKATESDIIDTAGLILLAERELLGPLDRDARALILSASKRVSVVTAVSPRAFVDLLYVLYEATRLVRAMADLYGGRPGTLGLMKLMRDVVAHLAVTGSIAVGDGLLQQILGHGLASKLSARLGEGVVNGLMTARIGIAAMDFCRPLPFNALKRPGITDFLGDLAPPGKNGQP
jgi:putative membrane protein